MLEKRNMEHRFLVPKITSKLVILLDELKSYLLSEHYRFPQNSILVYPEIARYQFHMLNIIIIIPQIKETDFTKK